MSVDLATPLPVPFPEQPTGDLLAAAGGAVPASRLVDVEVVDEVGAAVGAAAAELVRALALLRYDSDRGELAGRVVQHLDAAVRWVADASAALAPGRRAEGLLHTARCVR